MLTKNLNGNSKTIKEISTNKFSLNCNSITIFLINKNNATITTNLNTIIAGAYGTSSNGDRNRFQIGPFPLRLSKLPQEGS